jgi:tetratricopeptide (TPR) repeat protein
VDLSLAHWLTFSSEHVPRTKAFAEEALRIGREVGEMDAVAKSLSYIGLVYQMEGDLVKGDEHLEESLRISEAHGIKGPIPQNLTWLGGHAQWRGEFQKAIALSRRAEETGRENHDGLSELLGVAFRCLALIGLGEHAPALAVIKDGLALARERGVLWVAGRLTNSLGWLHQELGDFRRSAELNRESREIGQAAKNPNVEVSALINIGYDHFHLGETGKALEVLEDSVISVEKFGFGAHRWRWGMHLATYLAEVLLAQGQPDKALVQVEKALVTARDTGSQKYLGKAHLLRGRIAVAARDWARGEADLREAAVIARRIEYPNLIWPSAHALAAALAGRAEHERTGRANGDEARALAVLAAETIASIAEHAPDAALRSAFLAWTPVQAALDDLERLRRI